MTSWNANALRGYDENTFEKLSRCGYVYDTTEFVKSEGTCLKAPYKVGEMWVPTQKAMDGYLPKRQKEKGRILPLA